MTNAQSEPGEWLSIREASDLLQVSASSLRRWTDQRLISSSKTPGGHRRFRREDIEQLVQQLAVHSNLEITLAPYPTPPTEWHISSEHLSTQPWYARFAYPETAKGMRSMGQRLLGLLIQYITRRNDDARFLQEAREVGAEYGAVAARAGASLRDSLEAFLFFRRSFSQTAVQVPRVAHSSDADEIIRFTRRIEQFMDEVLAGMVSGHESVLGLSLQKVRGEAFSGTTGP